MPALLQLGEYPKTFALRDATPIEIRPLSREDKFALLRFFEGIPEDERFYLKENVAAPEVVARWTEEIDHDRVVPIVAVVGDDIIADATLHRSRSPARQSTGELRIVVAPEYRDLGLGARLLRELIEVGLMLRLHRLSMELVAHREEIAIAAAKGAGFRDAAILKEWVQDSWGNFEDLVLLELPLADYAAWWRY